jgi:sugar phosphate isomerase/epimerase
MSMLAERITLNTSEYRDLPWPERIEHFREMGFRFLEAGTQPEASARDYAKWLELVRHYEMEVVASHDGYAFLAASTSEEQACVQARFRENIERAAAAGAGCLIWYTGENPHLSGAPAVDQLLRRLEPLLSQAAQRKVSLLLETEFSLGGTDPAESLDLLEDLMRRADHPWLGVNFDPANLYTAGEEPFPRGYERLRPWIRHVHLKDGFLYDPQRHPGDRALQSAKGRTVAPCPVGEGALNLWGLLQALERDHYSGYLSLEPHVQRQDLDMANRKGLDFVQKALG